MNPRIARELRNRGRNSRAVEEIGLKGAGDAEIIDKVFNLYDETVLVTGDDSLPVDHVAALTKASATIATIAPWTATAESFAHWDGRKHRNEDEWEQEIVHRWAHVITAQTPGTIRRYHLDGYRNWTRGRGR